MIRIIIADDHQMFIDGLRSLLEHEKDIDIIGEAANGEELLSLLPDKKPDIILLDINMPVMDGLEATKLISASYPDVKILMLTMYNDAAFISGLLGSGAAGYILKNTGKAELLEAIHTLAEGGNYYSHEVTDTIMKSYTQKKPKAAEEQAIQLSKREKEVIKLIALEFTTQEIADKLFISQHTVETHRKNLLSKLNVRNTAGLVRYAVQQGLV